jgi:heme A synthase
MESIRTAAFASVGRACGFAFLGVVSVMTGLAYDPVLSVKSGAILSAIVALILVQRMFRAPTRDFRDTEVWIMLAKEVRPPAAFAQRMIGAALAESYRYCAIWAGCISGSLWMGYILLALI